MTKSVFGGRMDWLDAGTIRLQPGSVKADDNVTDLVWGAIDVTFANLDTGVEAANTGYWVWIYDNGAGGVAAALSLSPTTPAGIATGKWLYGWIRNNSASDIFEFRSDVAGDALDIWWVDSNGMGVLVSQAAGTQPVIFTALNASTLGYAPGAGPIDGLYIAGYGKIGDPNAGTWGVAGTAFLSVDGVGNTCFWSFPSQQWDSYIPTRGPVFYWKRAFVGDADDHTTIYSRGFRLNRSGITHV